MGIAVLIGAAICALGWLALWIYHKKTGKPWSGDSVGIMRIVTLVLCVVAVMLIVGSGNASNSGWWLEQATEEKTPAQVFLDLTSESTVEDMQRMAAERDLCVIDAGKESRSVEAFYVLVDSRYIAYKESNGVMLYAVFSKNTGRLVSEKLTIRTDEGTAVCRCNIAENGEASYKVWVKTEWYAPRQSFHPQTAQEAIEVVYDAVYTLESADDLL